MILEENTVICPYCKQKMSYKRIHNIDIKENCALKGDILSHKIFRVVCSCGKVFNAYYPFLYKDSIKGYQISYLYNDIDDNLVLRKVDKPYLITEKILIFDCFFDDRIIEIYKEFINASKKMDDDLVFAIDKDRNYKFIILKNGIAQGVIDFNKESYDSLYNKFRKYIKDSSSVIDKKWAQNFLMEVEFDD